jgi:hypothetical protein
MARHRRDLTRERPRLAGSAMSMDKTAYLLKPPEWVGTVRARRATLDRRFAPREVPCGTNLGTRDPQ